MSDMPVCILFLLCLTLSSIFCIGRGCSSMEFDNNCVIYIEKAANTKDIKVAETCIGKAIEYLEKNKLTEGSTTIYGSYNSSEDLSIFYGNLCSVRQDLQNGNNTVISKLYNTRTDSSPVQTSIISTLQVPAGISIYPHNGLYVELICLAALCLFLAVLISSMESY